ncbi:MAG: nitrile hydratase subunit beta [Limnohabitans sp.]|nr:nitrile hydratase subunit beta [Limnohabitans sp.]
MNGVHDMGGQQGFGPVHVEKNEPLFHADWESRAMAVTVAMGASGQWNIDLSRSARESLPPAVYLSSSYYEIWIRALEQLMLARGMVTQAELVSGQMTQAPVKVSRVLTRDTVDAALKAGSPTERPIDSPALFKVGQQVRARNMHPQGHTRLPRYVRGHTGTVVRVHGGHVFPDGHTLRATPPFNVPVQWLYTVVFKGTTLWGEQSDTSVEVTVDAWESYLEAVA